MRKPTTFEMQVYNVCSKVPKGQVTTYSAIAHALGKKCYRAVGQALNKNPHSPKVPCHRIVMANGELGGFGLGGQPKKIRMLKAENVQVKKGKIIDFSKKLFRPL